jgi:hypothetical protein
MLMRFLKRIALAALVIGLPVLRTCGWCATTHGSGRRVAAGRR